MELDHAERRLRLELSQGYSDLALKWLTRTVGLALLVIVAVKFPVALTTVLIPLLRRFL
jgi:hypothetical protein